MTIADILSDLLLPGVLGRAPARLGARGSIWYDVGAECRESYPELMGASAPGWGVVPPEAGAVPSTMRGQVWRLADRLWDRGGDRYGTPRSCHPWLAVADPVANVLTLSWRWRPEGLADRGSEDLRRLLGSRVEAFLDEAVETTRQLFQRPALHLVLLGESEAAPRELELVVQEILAQTGQYLPDLQVRWQELPSILDRDFLRRLLGFHVPWPVWPRGDLLRISGQEIDALAEVLERLSRGLEDLASGSVGPFEGAAELESMEQMVEGATLSVSGQVDPGEHETTRPAPPEEMVLAAQLRVRHWMSRPALVPFAPLTLLSGDNASGKTTFAEALSFVFTGLPRPRTPQPLGATRWRDFGGKALPPSQEEPSVDMLRLRMAAKDGAPEGVRSSELLALFADDADLAGASAGDLSIVTWLSFPGLRTSAPATGPRGLDVALLLAKAFGSFARIVEAGLEARWADPETTERRRGTQRLPEWLAGELRIAVESELDRQHEELAATQSNGRASKGKTKAAQAEIRAAQAEIRAAQAEIRKEIRRLERSLSKVPAEGGPASRAMLADTLDLLKKRLGEREGWTRAASEAWSDLRSLDQGLGGGTALQGLARRHALSSVSKVGEKLESLSRTLAEGLFSGPLETFEDDIRRFLAQQVQPPDDGRLKPNTAAVVRIGQASRLARWLATSGANWPLLVVDEPTLGQDDASCARALVRYLRLMRKAEAARWLAHDREAGGALPAVLERVTVPDLETWSAARLPAAGSGECQVCQSDLKLAVGPAPLPPQTVVLSYRQSALAVTADLEGTILDHAVQERLRSLIPDCWQEPLSASLREAHQRLEREVSRLLVNVGSSVPSSLLRGAWKPPFRRLAENRPATGWRQRAIEALEALGAMGIAEQVRGEEAPELRLLAWLVQVDLLLAALADGDEFFQVGTLTLRRLQARGGVAQEEGPIRLRRLLPIQDELPALPGSWKLELEKSPGPSPRTASPAGGAKGSVPTSSAATRAGHDREDPGSQGLQDSSGAPEQSIDPGTSKTSPQAHRGASPSAVGPERALWRVALVGDALGKFSPAVELVRLAIEAVGFEAVTSPGDAEVRVDLQARDVGLGPVEWKWRLDLVGGVSLQGRWEPQPASIDGLLGALLRSRVRALEAIGDPETPVEIVLATYNPREMPTWGAAFRFAVDLRAAEGLGEQKRRLREVFSDGLELLRTSLAESPVTRRLRFYPRCGLSVGLRAGAIFHRASGFHVECEQKGEVWNTDLFAGPPADAVVDVQGGGAATGPELHLLVSFSQEVVPEYGAWQRAGGTEGFAVRVAPSEGPGQQVLHDADDLAGWAALIRKVIGEYHPNVIAAHRDRKEWPIRLFVSSPSALAVAIGRQLNAQGRIIAMERDRRKPGYFEAFDFRT